MNDSGISGIKDSVSHGHSKRRFFLTETWSFSSTIFK